MSVGAHTDRYMLENTTYNTPEWTAGDFTTVATEGDGKTRTQAVWAQDAWRLTPTLRFTFGGRYESWKGYRRLQRRAARPTVKQPEISASKFSPKGALAWNPSLFWTVTASVGKAYRFATASELYQLVSTGTTFTSPNPDLKPDNVLASELRCGATVGSLARSGGAVPGRRSRRDHLAVPAARARLDAAVLVPRRTSTTSGRRAWSSC